jgi:hypothetical protein
MKHERCWEGHVNCLQNTTYNVAVTVNSVRESTPSTVTAPIQRAM